MQSEPTPPQPVDVERLMEFSDGTTESLRELITLYLDQTRTQLAQMEAAVVAADATELRRVAHSSAGASATCGVIALTPLLRELERMGQEQNLEGAQELFRKCEREFARAGEKLLSILDNPTAVSSPLR